MLTVITKTLKTFDVEILPEQLNEKHTILFQVDNATNETVNVFVVAKNKIPEETAEFYYRDFFENILEGFKRTAYRANGIGMDYRTASTPLLAIFDEDENLKSLEVK